MDFLEKNYIKIKLKYLKKAKVEYILSNILTILTVLATAIYPMLLSYIVDNYNSLNFSTLVYIFGILILSIIFLLMCTYFNKITKASFEKKITQSLKMFLYHFLVLVMKNSIPKKVMNMSHF